MFRLLPRSTLFPYTTLFRSLVQDERIVDDPGSAQDEERGRRGGRQPGPAGQPRRNPAQSRLQRSEEHTSELQSRLHLVCRLLLEKKSKYYDIESNLTNN